MNGKAVGTWLAAIGLVLSMVAALVASSERVTRLEGACQMIDYRQSKMEIVVDKRLDRMEQKIDKLLDRGQ